MKHRYHRDSPPTQISAQGPADAQRALPGVATPADQTALELLRQLSDREVHLGDLALRQGVQGAIRQAAATLHVASA